MLDCSPGQRDGQCGLSTFMGIASGTVIGGGFFVVGLVATAWRWCWVRRRAEKLIKDDLIVGKSEE
jgi:hypothetical protein